MIAENDLKNWFTYHRPTPEQNDLYEQLRSAAYKFAETINNLVPDCADKTAAIRKLREVMMTANSAIACNPMAGSDIHYPKSNMGVIS